MTLSRTISVFRNSNWLTRDRVIAAGQMLMIVELAILSFIALWQHGWIADTDPAATSSDFVSFYAAGKLALMGAPQLAYDQAAHYMAQEAVTLPGAPYQFFFYPPIFLFLCEALAWLPYALAYAAFQLLTLGLFIMTMRAVLREQGGAWFYPILAFPAVFWNIGLGQNAFLTASLFAAFSLNLTRRPVLAGVMLGLLSYKPHFGLLAPIALMAGGHWRTFLAAAVTVGGLILLSGTAFGWQTWVAYLSAFAGSNDVYASGRIDYAGMVTLFGAARLLGFAAWPAYSLQIVMGALMAGVVWLTWRRRLSLPLRISVLLTATMLAVPMALLYDKMTALVAIGWLIREARDTGFLPWEKLVLAAVYPLSLLTWMVGAALHLPLGPVVLMAMLLLCLRRVWRALPDTPKPATVPQALGATP
jgi:alpha-1,2-mannosyltransferase